MNIEEIEFDVDLSKIVNEKRTIAISTQSARYAGGELFRINMDGKTLLRFGQNGDLIIHMGDYSDYKYQLKNTNVEAGEITYRLVPSEKK